MKTSVAKKRKGSKLKTAALWLVVGFILGVVGADFAARSLQTVATVPKCRERHGVTLRIPFPLSLDELRTEQVQNPLYVMPPPAASASGTWL